MNGHRYSPQEMLARLVGFDTTSANSNLDLIEFVRGYLAAHGVAAHVLASEDGQKANLFATIGPHERRGIGLSGHTDVVPVTGQKWSSDPFTLTARDGRLYGRGSCDMKGFLAVALALVPDMVAAPLSDPLHLLLSYDEEVGCTGVRGMIEAFGRKLVKPRLIIVGEPTSMQVVDAHKSVQSFTTTVTGVAAHSSMIHLGANAIFAAGEIVRELADLRDEMIAHGDPSGRFDPPYSTIHVGRINGGTARNIVPQSCTIEWEMRGLPDADPKAVKARIELFSRQRVLPSLRAISRDTDITTKPGSTVPGLAPEAAGEAAALGLKLALGDEIGAVSYGTEAGLFQRAEIAAIVCGPGDIAQAHKPDEFVAISQLEECAAFVRRLIETAS